MEITDVRVHKVNKEENPKLKGYATVKIDDCFLISGIRIIEGKERTFCAMPHKKIVKDGVIRSEDIVHPTNEETRNMFESKILEEYNKVSEE